jgi:hypothetical protein
METTERVVESYVRYVKKWATIPNIRCDGQLEIDLFAIDPMTNERYHIETSVSISSGFNKLTGKDFCTEAVKQRVKAAEQRRTVGFFIERKFFAPHVLSMLGKFGCNDEGCNRIIVTWDWTNEAAAQAQRRNITLWRFGDLMNEIAESVRGRKAYFGDDTLRTLHLFSMATE